MADISESDYGMLDYGDGFYSYVPVWLFEANAAIPFYTYAELVSYAFRKFEADALIKFYSDIKLGVIRPFNSNQYIPVFAYSDEYIGPFWEGWQPPSSGGDENWIPDVPITEPWVPYAPISVGWAPVIVTGSWSQHSKTYGPWIPIGPDMRPNDG